MTITLHVNDSLSYNMKFIMNSMYYCHFKRHNSTYSIHHERHVFLYNLTLYSAGQYTCLGMCEVALINAMRELKNIKVAAYFLNFFNIFIVFVAKKY